MSPTFRSFVALSLGPLLLFAGSCADDSVGAVLSTDVGGEEEVLSVTDAREQPDVMVDSTADAPSADLVEDVAAALVVTEEDFACLNEWEPVRGFFLTNLLGNTAESVRVAEGGFTEPAPVGTVIQLVPIEAMVKLSPGSSPSTNDWEYFLLQNNSSGTAIMERGFAEVSNLAGTCNSCHANAAERDFVCEDTGLCAAAALPRDLVDQMVANDPRCD